VVKAISRTLIPRDLDIRVENNILTIPGSAISKKR